MKLLRQPRLLRLLVATFVSSLALVFLPTTAFATACPGSPAGIASNSTYNCDFTGWDFRNLSFTNVNFSTSYLAGSNFSGSTFTNSNMGVTAKHGINFSGSDFTGLTAPFGDMSSSDFSNANFTGADLHITHLEGSDMRNINLTGANIDNSFLDGADLTGAIVSQAQLALAVLTPSTVCPDGYTLGLHSGDCFSPLTPLVPTLSTPVITDGGYTFNVTNYNEEYTFTVVVQTGVGMPTIGSPTGPALPIAVTGVPSGSNTVVAVTATIGSISSTSTTSNSLANTGSPGAPALWTLGFLGSALISTGIYVT